MSSYAKRDKMRTQKSSLAIPYDQKRRRGSAGLEALFFNRQQEPKDCEEEGTRTVLTQAAEVEMYYEVASECMRLITNFSRR